MCRGYKTWKTGNSKYCQSSQCSSRCYGNTKISYIEHLSYTRCPLKIYLLLRGLWMNKQYVNRCVIQCTKGVRCRIFWYYHSNAMSIDWTDNIYCSQFSKFYTPYTHHSYIIYYYYILLM